MDNICVFEYKVTPGRGFMGSQGGYSICISSNGAIRKSRYMIGNNEPVYEKLLATLPELAMIIQDIIEQHSNELEFIPNRLYNGSHDGTIYSFRFGNKEITALNIKCSNPEEVQERNPAYYEKYKDNLAHENLVLDLFHEIAAECKQYNIYL